MASLLLFTDDRSEACQATVFIIGSYSPHVVGIMSSRCRHGSRTATVALTLKDAKPFNEQAFLLFNFPCKVGPNQHDTGRNNDLETKKQVIYKNAGASASNFPSRTTQSHVYRTILKYTVRTHHDGTDCACLSACHHQPNTPRLML